MANQQFQQPQRRRKETDDSYADDQGWSPTVSQPNQTSQDAEGTLDNIGDALAAQERLAAEQSNQRQTPSQEEAEPGFYNNEDDGGGKRSGSTNKGGGLTSGLRARLSGINLRSRKSIATLLVAGVLGGGGLFGLNASLGGFEVIHAGQILGHTSARGQSDSESRLSNFTRYAKAYKNKNIGYTRLGLVSGKVFVDGALSDLAEAGVTINTNIRNTPTTYEFDKATFAKNDSRVAGMSNNEFKQYVSDKTKVTGDSILIDSKTGNATIDTTKLKFSAIRQLNGKLTQSLADNKATTAMRTRELNKFFGLDSLFHPFSRAFDQKVNDYLNTKADKKKTAAENKADAETAAQNELLTEERAPVETKATIDAQKVSDEKNSPKTKILGAALGALALACVVRSTSGAIVDINYQRIVLPSEVAAVNLEAQGSALMYGRPGSEISAAQAQQAEKDASQLFKSPAFQSLDGSKVDKSANNMPASYQAAFDGDTTAGHIHDLATKVLGGGISAEALCSNAFAAGVLAAVIAGAAAEAFFAPETGGLDVAATAGGYEALSQAESAILAGTVIGAITKGIVDAADPGVIKQSVFSSPVGGSLIAYGARAASNTTAMAAGGIELGNKATTLASEEQLQQDNKEFASKSMFARIFDLKDYRSLTGRLADAFAGSSANRVTAFTNIFTNIGSTFSSVFGSLVPRVAAATSGSFSGNYVWGFSQYGIPDFLLNDPDLQDPYANANDVAQIFAASGCAQDANTVNTDCGPAKRMKSCFGATLSVTDSVWDTTAEESVNPQSDDYVQANCNPFKNSRASDDPDWARIIMFVFDTPTAKAEACYQGDAQSCKDLDVGTASDDSGNIGGSQFRISSFNLCYGIQGSGSGFATCAAGQDYTTRLARSVAYIQKSGLQVVGLQEVRGPSTPKGDQYDAIQQALPNYGIFPTRYSDGYAAQDPIIWDTSKFTLDTSGSKLIPGYTVTSGPLPTAANTQVKLKDNATGQEFYVINEHEPVITGSGGARQAAIWRRDSATQRAAYIKQLSAEGLPVFLTGDMNSFYQPDGGNQHALDDSWDNLPYCILTSGAGLTDAYDAAKNQPSKCPNSNPVGGVDHIYMTAGVTASNYTYTFGGVNNNGSDHKTLFADITIPGTGGTVTSTNYKNPIIDQQSAGESVIRDSDGTFQLYATGDGKIQHWTSKDAVNWQGQSSLPIVGAPGNTTAQIWKPSISKINNTYVMAYAGGTGGGHGFNIYYATSSSPGGPFKYGGKLASALSSSTNAIDPQIYNDNGDYYLYYTNGGTYGLRGVKLNVNGTSITPSGTPKLLVSYDPQGHADTHTIEAPYVINRNGYYYMFFSTGDYTVRGDYRVQVARSTSPLGPFTRKPGNDVILQSNAAWVGPGTTTMFTDDANQDWMIYAARYPSGRTDRVSMLDKVTYDAEGWPIVNGGNGASSTTMPGPAIRTAGGTSPGGQSDITDTYGPACTGQGGSTFSVACSGECVDYIEYLLDKTYNKPGGYTSFGTGANTVPKLVSTYGFKSDASAQVGDVVSWPPGGVPGQKADSDAGHTAAVIKVNADGSIVVAEWNWTNNGPVTLHDAYGDHSFDTRTVPAAIASQLSYAHTNLSFN